MDVRCPHVAPGRLLAQTRASLISADTERMLVEFGRAYLLEKARQSRPSDPRRSMGREAQPDRRGARRNQWSQ